MSIKKIVPIEWVSDLKEFLVENEFAAQWDLVSCYHEVGKRIVESPFKDMVQEVASALGRSERVVQRMVQFYKKFPELSSLPEGKNTSWTKIYKKYLLEENRHSETELKSIKANIEKRLGETDIIGHISDAPKMVEEAVVVPTEKQEHQGISYLEVQKILKRIVNFDPDINFLVIQVVRGEEAFDLKIASDKKIPTNQKNKSTCPNKEEGHKGCVEYINSVQNEDKGHKFINFPKQIACLHKILRAGFNFEDMDGAIEKIKKEQFYQQKGWDFATVASILERGNK